MLILTLFSPHDNSPYIQYTFNNPIQNLFILITTPHTQHYNGFIHHPLKTLRTNRNPS